ncbi:MAG: hypothetical protein QM762_19690 [Chryseolinea sp.]
MTVFRYIPVLLAAFLMLACHKEEPHQLETAFTLSDTMMARSGFERVSMHAG